MFILGVTGYIVGSLLELHIRADRLLVVFVAAAAYGFAFGCSWVSLNTIIGNIYRIAAFPKLNGWMMISTAFTCAPADVIGGILFDRYKSYTPTLELNLVLCIVGMTALLFARMPAYRGSTQSMQGADYSRSARTLST